MATLIQRGASVHGSRLKLAAGRSVTLHWRNKEITVTGSVARVEYEVNDEQGASLVESWDWTFTAADLEIDGQTVRPTKGYQIRETLNGQEVRYDVMPVGMKPPTESLDANEILILVHTKRVSA